MKINKRIVLYCLLGVLLCVSSAAVYVMHTAAMYSGVCGKLDGFPGMLQSAGFVATGTCKFTDKKCDTGTICKVDGKKGKCVEEVVNKKPECICKPVTISK
jgi:hypothetical protein